MHTITVFFPATWSALEKRVWLRERGLIPIGFGQVAFRDWY